MAIEEQPSCGFVQDTYGRRISWKDTRPVVIYLSTSWPAEFVETAKRAAKAWDDALGYQVLSIDLDSQAVGSTSEKDFKNGLYWHTDWPEEKNTIQALTRTISSENKFIDSDIKVNAKNFQYYDLSSTDPKQVHLESLLIHEMGHLLGLKHFLIPPTVMDPYLRRNYERTTISETDLAATKCEYSL